MLEKLDKNNVKYYSLGELCDIKKGKQLNRNLLSKTGQYPVMNGGINASGYWHEFNCISNTITFSQGGENAGHVNFLFTNFWAGAHCYYLENLDQSLNVRFLYHFLKFSESKIKEMAHGAALKGLSSKKLFNFLVPLPTLETQCKIAKVLDTFSELTAEFTAELTARKKQYKYYRDLLINKKLNKEGVEYKTLGELCEIKRGKALKKIEFKKLGYPVISGGKGILSFSDKYNHEGDSITVARCGTAGYVQWQKDPFWMTDNCFSLNSKVDFIDKKFLYYALTANQNEIYRLVSQGIPANVKPDKLKVLKIPVPSLETQKQIANILDKFSTLCNDITKGLPAEIALNQKRYEYYRNKLLTFEKEY